MVFPHKFSFKTYCTHTRQTGEDRQRASDKKPDVNEKNRFKQDLFFPHFPFFSFSRMLDPTRRRLFRFLFSPLLFDDACQAKKILSPLSTTNFGRRRWRRERGKERVEEEEKNEKDGGDFWWDVVVDGNFRSSMLSIRRTIPTVEEEPRSS